MTPHHARAFKTKVDDDAAEYIRRDVVERRLREAIERARRAERKRVEDLGASDG